MKKYKAKIERNDQDTVLILSIPEEDQRIVLTQDKPGDVKSVFNHLLKNLKKGEFEFEFEDDNEDLFHEVCKVYISHLNAEIKKTYKELADHDLLDEE